jgi:CheY-like chemotaxis protein
MPEVDGYLASLKIRQSEKRNRNEKKRIPIIALTAHAMKGERQKVRAAGMDDYLSKPVEPKTLIEFLDKWISPAEP